MTDAATLTAFLFTDIEGSSLKWLNRRAAMQGALAEHDRILRAAIAAHEGEVFKTAGDAFFAAFKRPPDAANAAIAAQKALAAHDWSAVDGLKVRMAVHCGTAEKREGDWFGPALNRCARLLVLGHGGQLLITAATAELLASEREVKDPSRLIGTHPLDDPAQPVAIHQVLIAGLPQDFPPLRAPETRPTNLPRHLTPLIGREKELQAVKDLVAANRLVTLTGPGGVGKTRLAIEAGLELLPQFANGVWLVELAPLADPNLLVSAVGTALGLDLRGNRNARDILISHLEHHDALVLLDNCEHLIGAVAELVEVLLARTSKVRIAASSQELIGLPGERVFRVASLSVPDSTAPTADEAMTASAVQLFVERTRAVDPSFALSAKSAPIVSAICRRLDGIALAIEMAAARAPALGVEALAQGLDARFQILTGGKRTALPRQRTLHAALDWSHALLDERDRVVFRRLGPFAGGFTLKAATAVVTDDKLRDFEVIDCLADLVAKSLVAADTIEEGVRYRLLETTRAYALERLGEAGEIEAIARRHATYFRDKMIESYDRWFKIPTVTWRAAYAREVDNLRAAMDWACARKEDGELALALASYSYTLLDHLNLFDEIQTWLAAAETRLSPSTPRHVEAQHRAASGAALFNGGYTPTDDAVQSLERAAQFCRDSLERRTLARVLIFLGLCHLNRGEADKAESALMEAKPILLELESTGGKAWVQVAMGMLAVFRGDLPHARELLESAIGTARDAGVLPAWDFGESILVNVIHRMGESERAKEMYRALAGRISQQPIVDLRRLLLTKAGLCTLLAELGERTEALKELHESLAIARRIGVVATFVDGFAYVAAKTGAHELAARLIGWSDHLVATKRHQRVFRGQFMRASAEAIVRKVLPGPDADRLSSEGSALSEDEAVELLSAYR
jgi:predicted ATPase/class 3 adenylate cyclase